MENKNDSVVIEQQERPRKNLIYLILEVLYAPHRAFKQIVQEPKYLGLILILILFIAASTIYGYSILSRSYIEQTQPIPDPYTMKFDVWTENATLWATSSGAKIAEDFNDFVNGSYYGNRSIAFSMPKSAQIFMTLMDIGPVNCSSPYGYKNMSIKIKIADPKIMPSNASIYLFSEKSSDYLYYNLTDTFSRSTVNIWNNLTIPLATESWVNSSGDWSNITGMRLEFGWPEDSNISVLVDGLYFRGVFLTPLDIDTTGYLFSYSLSSLLQFAIQLFFITSIIFILLRVFGAKTLWKPIIVSVGFALIVLSVQALINTVVVLSTLPKLFYQFEFLGGTPTEMAIAIAKMNDQASLFFTVSSYIQIMIFMWITVLCSTANRLVTQLSWTKSFGASAVAVFTTYVITTLFGL